MHALNKIYRTIWSEALGAWVAVSEQVRSKGKRASSILMCFLNVGGVDGAADDIHHHRFKLSTMAVLCLLSFGAQANPTGGNVVNGSATFNASGNTLTVTNTPGTIINWQDFSIQQNEITRFNQQSASSAVLNRVVSGNTSQILGSLQSNGRVFLVNPNGVVFGAGSTVDVAGLVATSLNLSDADFLAGRNRFTSNPNAQAISNAGNLTAQQGGEIWLIAPNVENSGVITAPDGEILLAAGSSVELVNSLDPNLRVNITAPAGDATNVGQLVASAGRLGLFGTIVRNSGQVSADSATMQGGKIVFKSSQRTEISGTVSASGTTGGTVAVLGNEVGVMEGAVLRADGTQGGGVVLIGGDYQGKNPDVQNAQVTYVAPTATISADAIDAGDGGKVIVWADDTTRAYGDISAKGGVNGGDGGFIETSGHYLDVAGIRVSTASPIGSGGSWLLDPYDIVIGATDTPASYTGSPNFVGAGGATSYIGATVIAGVLDGGTSVIVDTTGAAAGAGNITVDASINTANAGATTLTLKAHNDIVINAPLSMNNNLVLTADQDVSGAGSVMLNKSVIAGSSIVASGQDIIFDSLDGGTTYGQLNANSVALTAANVITPSNWGAATEVIAQSLSLNAVNGIGNSGKVFVANVFGAINFSNTNNAVNIYNTSAGISRSFTGTNTNGPVRLESFDSTYATTLDNITSGGTLLLRMNNLTTGASAVINAGANTVYINPYTISPSVPAISIGGASTFNLTGADISKIAAGNIVIGTDTFGNYASTVNIATSAPVTITNSANLEIFGTAVINTGTSAFTNTGGTLRLIGDSMVIGGTIDVGASGKVSIDPNTATQNVDVGGADSAGVLGVSATELSLITAGTLLVGDPLKSGSLNVSSSIAPAGVSVLGLGAGGAVTQSAGAGITVNELVIDSRTSVNLSDSTNAVGNLAAFSSGDFIFNSSTALNLVANNVEFINGVSATGMIALTSAGALTQSAGATLNSTSAYVKGSKVILNEANTVGVIAGSATGATTGDIFSYKSSNAIFVTTVNGFSGIQTGFSQPDAVTVILNAGSAGITQDAPIDAGAKGVSLTTTGSVNLVNPSNSMGAVTATGISSLALYGASTVDVVTSVPTFTILDQLTAWGAINITNNGGSIAVNNAQVTSYGIATFTATGSLKIDATSANSYIMGAPDVDLFLGGDISFVTSGGFNAYVSSQLPVTTHLTFSNSTARAFFNGTQAAATTSGNTGFFYGGDPLQGGLPAELGVNLVLVGGDTNNFIPIPTTTTPVTTTTTTTTVTPTLTECLAGTSATGCTEVLQTATQDITQTLPVANAPAKDTTEEEKKKEEEQILAEAEIGNGQGSGLPDNLPACR
ncbi:two-partner secretion domain-containing protein [Sideroxydans sp.]